MKNQSRKRPADPLWDIKDDAKRRNWKDQEVITMLNLIKKHNLLEHFPTDAQLGETLLKPMKNLGYLRTAHQIKLKIKSLRKSYNQSRKGNADKSRINTFYEILDSLYRDTESKESDSEEDICEVEENSIMWSESEVNRLLLTIKQHDLSQELSVGNISLKSLRQVQKSLQHFDVTKSLYQIKTLLLSLRNTYANYKKQLANGFKKNDFPYFEQLDALWKRDYANGQFYSSDGYDEFWSEEETILLLEAIKEIGVTDINNSNNDYVSTKVQEFLIDSGYKRTTFQILKRLENLKQNYNMSKKCSNLDEAISKFPFYHRYENVFNISKNFDCRIENTSEIHNEVDEKSDSENVVVEKKKHSRGYIWVEEEILSLLNLVENKNMISIFRGRMTLEYITELVAPMADLGFERTAGQIKIKLKCLRNQYYRCINDNMSSKEEFPYFDKIHKMVKLIDLNPQMSKSSQKNTLTKTSKLKKKEILKEIIVDIDDQNFNTEFDETDVKYCNKVNKDNDNIEIWQPLESIPDYDNEPINIEHYIIENEDQLSDMFEEISEEESENKNYTGFDENHSSEVNIEGKMQEEYIQYDELIYDDVEQISVKNNVDESENIQIGEEIPEDAHKLDKVLPNINMDENISDNDENNYVENLESTAELTETNSTHDILMRILKHEEKLQHQHHLWLEKQFEIQRRHDGEHRSELLKELRELRLAITSNELK